MLTKQSTKTQEINLPKPKIVSFREEVSDISSSKYLTHSIYYHPAKFIPQIVRYCLDNYCKDKGIVLDPFAGSGTTALESSIKGHNSYMVDINPLLDYFYPIKMPEFNLKQWKRYFVDAKKFLEKENIKEIIEKKAPIFLNEINESVSELLRGKKLTGKIDYFSGVDAYKFDFKKLPKLDCIITSPLYLQAQEYMGTFKMEIRWSGISNVKIKEYTHKEIPFRKTEGRKEKSKDKGIVKSRLRYFFRITNKTVAEVRESRKNLIDYSLYLNNFEQLQ